MAGAEIKCHGHENCFCITLFSLQVLFVWPTADEVEVVPLRFDNVTLAPVKTGHLPGIYQHDLFFYHDRVDKFELFEERHNLRVWECMMYIAFVICGYHVLHLTRMVAAWFAKRDCFNILDTLSRIRASSLESLTISP